MRQSAAAADHAQAEAVDGSGAGADRENWGDDPGGGRAITNPNAIRPDVFTFSTAITACANAGQRRRALALLEDMRAEGVVPNVSWCFCGYLVP